LPFPFVSDHSFERRKMRLVLNVDEHHAALVSVQVDRSGR
jgi:hypothetical protein